MQKRLVLLLIALGVTLTAVAFIGASAVFTRYVWTAAESEAQQERDLALRLLGHTQEAYRNRAAVIGNDTMAKEALLSRSRAVAFTFVDAVAERTGTQHVVLFERRGELLSSAGGDLGTLGADLGQQLTRDGEASGLLRLRDDLYAVATVPITMQDRTLGLLMMGETVGQERLDDLKPRPGSEVTLESGDLVSSTLSAAASQQVLSSTGGCKHDGYARATIAGEPTSVAYGPIQAVAGGAALCFAISRSAAPQLAAVNDFQRLLLLIGVVVTALGVGAGIFVVRRLAAPIVALTGAAKRIAEGDLHQPPVESTSDDEVAELASAFNQMLAALRQLAGVARDISGGDLTGAVAVPGEIGSLFNEMLATQRTTVRQLSLTTTEVAQATARISSAVHEQEAAATQQASSVARVSHTVEALLSSACRIAESAGGVLASAERSSRTSDELERRTRDLNEQLQRIGDLLGSIRDIANRSDVLALNAALEAASAGEAGESFALIATETRRLAERVATSAREAKSLVNDLDKYGKAALVATEEGRALVGETTESARRISAVTEEQRHATKQVLESLQLITEILGQSAATVSETRSSVDRLRREANRAATMVKKFVVEAPASGAA